MGKDDRSEGGGKMTMTTDMTQRQEEKIAWLADLFLCGQKLYLWSFDDERRLLWTSCPEGSPLIGLPLLSALLSEALSPEISKPLLLMDSLSMNWIACPAPSQRKVFVMGPFLTREFSVKQTIRQLDQMHYTIADRPRLMRALLAIPTFPQNTALQYGAMLQYCISGNRIEASDFHYYSTAERQPNAPSGPMAAFNTYGSAEEEYSAEQQLLLAVENGNPDYGIVKNRLIDTSMGTLFNRLGELRRFKNYVIVFTAMCARAAIRGGLDAETAFSLCGDYMVDTENASDLSELQQISSAMLDDYVRRVNEIRSSAGVSAAIRVCCHYIDLHLGEKLTLENIARRIGYDSEYLGKKFKKEMGVGISAYIKTRRIEQAKILLRSTGRSIADISSELGFRSQSHFSDAFLRVVGKRPGAYRESMD